MDTIGVILLLLVAGVWAFFLLPSLFSARRDAPVSTTQQFSRLTARLESVQRAAIGSVHGPSRRTVLARRKRALLLLLLFAVVTLGLALWLNSVILLGLHLAIDALTAWYVVRLVQIRQRRQMASGIIGLGAEEPEEKQIRVVAYR